MNDAACPNCGSPVVRRYCAVCGQRQGEELIPSLRGWLREAADDLFLVEARLPKTVRALFWPPGQLTREWWEGRRASYVTPLRLYLLFAIPFFFALAARSAGSDLRDAGLLEDVVGGSYIVTQNPSAEGDPPLPPLPADLRSDSAAWEEWRTESRRRRARNDSLNAVIDQRIESGIGRMYDLLPIAVGITMVPFLALLLRLIAREHGFVANLVLSLHLHAVLYALIGLGWLLGLGWFVGAGAITGLVGGTAYMGAALHRITGEPIRWVVAQCLITLIVYPLGFILLFLGLVMGVGTFFPGWAFGV